MWIHADGSSQSSMHKHRLIEMSKSCTRAVRKKQELTTDAVKSTQTRG